jgi:nucleolar protein TMA23
MNAESYLRAQGWKGSGHSLDATGRGIKKPLLISHKQDQLGLGKKKAAYTTDDQWWMRAYDQSLQSIGTGQESTLDQIRTKGINRGGLYGFFVKGEEIKGTMEDSTEDDAPRSGASTPPTSASDTEAPTTSEPAKKRKRNDNDAPPTSKKPKKERRAKDTRRDATASSPNQLVATRSEQLAIDAKLAKLSPRKRKWYQDRATIQNTTIEQVLLRRIQKSTKKLAKRKAKKPVVTTAFFTDLAGDATLAQQAATTAPGQPVLSADAEVLAKAERKAQRKATKEARKADPKKRVKPIEQGSRNDSRKASKARKKAERAERGKDTKSKWGDNKEDSRWGKLKKTEKEAALL